jgi:4-amino-4-deoxychorismate lyase
MLLNGQPANAISLQDRGLAYGDGLFESILVRNHRPVFLTEHLQRLQRGCLRLALVYDAAAVQQELATVLAMPAAANCVLKLMLTRCAGGRGYRAGTDECNRLISLHPLPDYADSQPEQGIAMFVCQQRLARQPTLAGLKHLNRLEQVLASREWPDASFHEGLMLDTAGLVIEGTRSNVFVVQAGRLQTPPLHQCGVDGVLRQVLLQHFGNTVSQTELRLEQLQQAAEIFVCNSVFGVWPVTGLLTAEQRWHYPLGDYARAAQRCFHEALQ